MDKNHKETLNKIRAMKIVLATLICAFALVVTVGAYMILDDLTITNKVASTHAEEPSAQATEVPNDVPDTLVYDVLKSSAYWNDMQYIVDNPSEYKLQILYTSIYREDDSIKFVPHFYGMDENTYFYPASAIKLAAVLGAIDKVNTLGGDINTVYKTTKTAKPLSHYMEQILRVSDNYSFDMLFDFLGQTEFNEMMWEKGYPSVRAVRYLHTIGNSQFTPAFELQKDKRTFYVGTAKKNTMQDANAGMDNLLVGTSYYNSKRQLVKQPYNFTNNNRVSLVDMQNMLHQVFFRSDIPADKRFNFTDEDIRFLRREMLGTGNGSVKWFFCGGKETMPTRVNVYSKSGIAFGFLTDNAYVKDDSGNEFFLSATIYCNEDGIINDDKYDYNTVGMPFLKDLGFAFWEYEKSKGK